MGKLGGISNRGNDIAQPHGQADEPLFDRRSSRIRAVFVSKLHLLLTQIFIDGLSRLELSLLHRERNQGFRTQRLPTPQGAIPLLLPAEARRRRQPRRGNCDHF